ncbi:MAG: hypothetical protein Q7W51_09250 [Coriobacteriia bacterium]|nr:hypothetical protein [Coriobacteriia bacterium]
MPRLRMPLWAAVVIPTAAYAVRSLVRGSVSPDLPADALAFGALALVLGLAALYRASTHDSRDELTEQVDGGDGAEGTER